ncbi:Phosphatidylinositolglycan class N-domain-containing protein [Gymnopilus junonius]|uniref:GPI ethanolamine phosphate transferase 1 n=1 Tax=Gymnopilus junonius TaxID=109634 RepID=A0A9P5TQS9_GYMJU|nr:Phosphatidylinositolglycan class N-domain-containing protein [Gymnopilus junonius]
MKGQNSRYNVAKLLLIGLVFHLVYIGCAWDEELWIPNEGVAPSKRLVLIVGDGLRADLLFSLNAFADIPGSPEIVAPHLRSIVESRGAFGISHTRVPTESRPGHVAIIGKYFTCGMYEDVSAVTKGWKTNPVDFDSVFNQSKSTYSFGSPDILPMFAKGATPGKVKTWTYNEDEEDFTKDATALDVWVLDRLKSLFQNATSDPRLLEDLRSEKVVFFLHLLGLDTTGHSYRPHSKEYMHNIRVVDDIVRETESLMSEFYQDNSTSFIFTADHGMSVIGNHGDGHPDNTRTPLVAWGSGIRGPVLDTTPSAHDTFSASWQLGHLFRRDVEQADIASLMAALIGVNWPVNSVGVLPDVDSTRPGYLDPKLGEEALAHAAFVNAKVILEQFRVKDELKRKHTIFYKSLKPLSEFSFTDDAPQILKIEQLITEKRWDAARFASSEVIQEALKGLHYLQTYDRFLIRAFVTAAYFGWAAYASLYLLRPLDNIPQAASFLATSQAASALTVAGWTVLVGFWISFILQRSPWSFYIYIAFPCYFWHQFLVQAFVTLKLGPQLQMSLSQMISTSVMVVLALLGMVVGYKHRSIWSIGFVFIGLLWPLSRGKDVHSRSPWYTSFWAISCLVTGVFPLLSVDKTESLTTITIGGFAILLTGSAVAWRIVQSTKKPSTQTMLAKLFVCQIFFIGFTMAITASSVRHLQAKKGLPAQNQWAGWLVLVISSVLPFAFRGQGHTKYSKILMYFLGFGPCFVILSISVEGLFFLAYSAVLITWIQVEKAVRSSNAAASSSNTTEPSIEEMKVTKSELELAIAHKFDLDDLRIALFFLFFVQVGFFGTGNVASISSFYLAPVYRLIPIFNPFYMSALLIFKIIAPYIMLSITFAVLNDALNLPPFSLLLVALTITDGMTLAFFYNVQDTGSWLEIGQSISFFCITSLLLLWAAGICAAGEYLMADVLSLSLVKDPKKVD